MKRILPLAGALFTLVAASAQDSSLDSVGANVSSTVSNQFVLRKLPDQPWRAVQRLAHETIWQSIQGISNSATREVQLLTNSFIEIGGGLNVLGADGKYVAADLSLEITGRGAEGKRAAHQVVFPANINESAMVADFPDGTRLEARPVSFGYYDPVDGRTVVLGTLTDAVGWLVASNVVVYSNCFSGGISASIRLRNNLGGPAQDLLIHEQLPEPQEFGLSTSSRLEMFSELLGQTPTPQQESRTIHSEQDPALRSSMREPDFRDDAHVRRRAHGGRPCLHRGGWSERPRN